MTTLRFEAGTFVAMPSDRMSTAATIVSGTADVWAGERWLGVLSPGERLDTPARLDYGSRLRLTARSTLVVSLAQGWSR